MKNRVFLTQTDTTVGFISKSKKALDTAKQRTPNKVYITALPSLKNLKKRVPNIHKKRVRRAKKTTFILTPYFSFRVIRDKEHNLLLNRLNYAYSSSANKSNKKFNYSYAYKHSDIIIYQNSNLTFSINKNKPSSIYKLGKTKLKRIR